MHLHGDHDDKQPKIKKYAEGASNKNQISGVNTVKPTGVAMALLIHTSHTLWNREGHVMCLLVDGGGRTNERANKPTTSLQILYLMPNWISSSADEFRPFQRLLNKWFALRWEDGWRRKGPWLKTFPVFEMADEGQRTKRRETSYILHTGNVFAVKLKYCNLIFETFCGAKHALTVCYDLRWSREPLYTIFMFVFILRFRVISKIFAAFYFFFKVHNNTILSAHELFDIFTFCNMHQ